MDILPKIGICIGIGTALVFLSIFLIMVLPHVIEDSKRQWDEVLMPKLSNEELRLLFYKTEAYKTFLERYPGAGEYFQPYGNGEGEMEVNAMNFETGNMLRLEIRYEKHEDMRLEIRCIDQSMGDHFNVRGTLAVQFIKETSCLEDEGLVAAPSPLVDENGRPVHVCGSNAETVNGVCVAMKDN